MDLWEKFGMSEGLAEMWQELGISAGTAIIVLIALYFVVKWAVKNGMLEAYKEIEKKKAQEALKADKTIIDLEQKK
ncbi:hypothetical protein C817_04302 [Dorea sp. 5-2]|jgi:hypothetical protein|nr:hypothetical protein C817_04302 [Dorea sp. 5-2]